ncbi:sigma-70 family RNA polymerase sigma factor [Streptomyces sp. NBC_01381]|uniref:sigma-70 family RNA polymerase sigma factor n=1 Tax=Streptomyces sp. NBC_01381 TaxID=2903845 RepID=UPI002258C7D0|nr:sigma-70 family RNA polymerase sigma factor [Streptomyces sp. NBC_01381]MCX4671927.1 sigma-70 family RNA polymerase sigma factor [Streptomyces sp. NBC_01381]
MSSEREVAMIMAARAGNEQAQDDLVAEYLPLVYNIVGRALNGHADVDDVVQETMLRVLAGLEGLRSPESFRSWLVAITMNQIRGHWRGRGAEPIPAGGGLADAYDVVDPGADFVDLTIARLGLSGQRRETAEATRWLDEDDRALLSLWWLESAGELSRVEVAAALEQTPQHTAVRVQRMKAQLETARVVVRALAADPRCVQLEQIAAGWDGAPSALWRKRLARHARDCAACASHWSNLVPAERLLIALGLVPVAAALADRVAAPGLVTVANAHAAPSAAHSAAPSARGRARLRRTRRRRRNATVAAAAAALLIGGGTAYVLATPESEETSPSTAAATESPISASPSKSPSKSPKPSASPSKTKAKAKPKPTKTKAKPSPTPTKAKPTPKPTKTAAPPPATPSGVADQVIALVNTERSKAGCGPVTSNSKLATAATNHSADMAARDYFDHTSPDGKDPGDRITAAGYRWSTYGENIARGQQTPASVMDSWMNSEGHKANILNCSFKELGVGIHNGSGGPWWTQAFGAAL